MRLVGGQFVALELGARDELLLGQFLGPFQLVLGHLELLVGNFDVRVRLLDRLEVIPFLVLSQVQLGEPGVELGLSDVAFALALDDGLVLLCSDKRRLRVHHGDFLLGLRVHQVARIELRQELSLLDVGAFRDEH